MTEPLDPTSPAPDHQPSSAVEHGAGASVPLPTSAAHPDSRPAERTPDASDASDSSSPAAASRTPESASRTGRDRPLVADRNVPQPSWSTTRNGTITNRTSTNGPDPSTNGNGAESNGNGHRSAPAAGGLGTGTERRAAGRRAMASPVRRLAALGRVGAVLALAYVAHRWWGEAATTWEARTSADVARRIGLDGAFAIPHQPLVRSDHAGQLYLIRVTNSCSALTPAVGLIGLSMLVLGGPWWRRVLAAAVALVPVVVGNLLRIASILWVGDRQGTKALVSFHDSWATAFSYLYLVVAFAVLIALRLPGRRGWNVGREPVPVGV